MRKLTLLTSDIVAFYSALALVLFARHGMHGFANAWADHVVPFSELMSVWLLSFYISNLYDERTLRNDREFFGRIVQSTALAGILSIAFFYLLPQFGITPKTNLFLFIIAFGLLVAGMRWIANHILASGSKKRLVIVGAGEEAASLAQFIVSNPQLGWAVRAMVRVGQESLHLDRLSGTWETLDEDVDLGRFIAEKSIDTIVISPEAYDRAYLVATLYASLDRQINFASLATFSEQLTGTVPLGAISQQWFLENMTEGSKKAYETAKRALDIVAVGILGIPTLFLAPFIALAIAIDSPGPIFFRQKRTGRHGIAFDIFKFRTMRMDAEAHTGAVWALQNDPRITRIGQFLRKTRIDELPQLINILKGHMSLVGPRAERPEFDAQLTGQVAFYRERYLIKPGLSGWAQINYPYGASTADAMRKLEYDLYYIKHRSLMLDVEIILKTISTTLRLAGR